MIVNIISKVYGPSIKNFYDDGSDLGLMNFRDIGVLGFFRAK